MRNTEFFFWILILPCVGAGIHAILADLILVELVTHLCLSKLASECDFEPFKPACLQWKCTALGLALGCDVAGCHQERDLPSLSIFQQDLDGKGMSLSIGGGTLRMSSLIFSSWTKDGLWAGSKPLRNAYISFLSMISGRLRCSGANLWLSMRGNVTLNNYYVFWNGRHCKSLNRPSPQGALVPHSRLLLWKEWAPSISAFKLRVGW